MEGCRNLARGVRWRDAGVADSKGCGSAMRVAPIGLYYTDLDQVAEVARASSLLTHGHPAALEAATAGALMVAMALTGASPEQIFDEINARCRVSADFTATWNKVPVLKSQPPEEVLVKNGLGEGWVAEEAYITPPASQASHRPKSMKVRGEEILGVPGGITVP